MLGWELFPKYFFKNSKAAVTGCDSAVFCRCDFVMQFWKVFVCMLWSAQFCVQGWVRRMGSPHSGTSEQWLQPCPAPLTQASGQSRTRDFTAPGAFLDTWELMGG